ncbi:MAG TPA: peptidylprolyl isomerase [Candidatus Polarisedimenticolia bacterium]|nr:peptidylprolyl isomerase [Candidatus Polarisedimenticolia bacterium]
MSASFVRRRATILAPLALVSAGLLCSIPARSEEGPKLYVHMETPGRFSYAGDPAQVTIFFKNEGSSTWVNPGLDLESGFEVYDGDGNKIEKVKAPASSRDSQPKVLEPLAYFGKIVDLTALFPKMSAVGRYRITWSAPSIPEQTTVTRVIRKYDPKRDYQAVLDTDFGKIVLEFHKDLAPFHVKNFIDLVNQGFYDNLLFHRIIKGEVAIGGSPTGDERGSPGYDVSPEPNGLKVLEGSVAQVRNAQTGSNESGSIFMIAVTPQPDMDSRVTVFARVAEGLDTVKAIVNLQTVGGPPRAPSRPIKDVTIRKIEIREKKSAKS